MQVATTEKARVFTGLHEHGHHVTRALYRGAAGGRPELAEWWNSVTQSAAFKYLNSLHEDLTARAARGERVEPSGLEKLAEALKPNELICRAYAQWAATVGPSVRAKAGPNIRRLSHWEAGDFEAFSDAFDKRFCRRTDDLP